VADHPAGQLLDALGVTVTLADGQQLVEAVVIGKAIGFDDVERSTSLVIGSSDGLDWIAQRGLVAAANDVLSGDIRRDED
jgi:hypothetical protein